MTPTFRTNTLLRLTCAAGATLTTVVIGLLIDSLARNYHEQAEALAAARPVIVAHAQPR
jgi:hypothetical protein